MKITINWIAVFFFAFLYTVAGFSFCAFAAGESSSDLTFNDDNCTAVYVGPSVSDDGTVMIARCADTHPTTVSVYLNIREASDKPGRVVTGNNGFQYSLPDRTYKYISIPRPAALEKGNSWDSAASNEMGVAVTATVTAYVCDAALKADPYVTNGITEDNIAGIIAACAPTARAGIEQIAAIIDEQGSGESNIFMVADRAECWYMEIYTGHQYAAVKLPEDCVAGFGNEFMLDDLGGFEDVIVSDGLVSCPAKAGFACYNADGELNLFHTYSGKGRLADYANLRTWRIHQLLSPSTSGRYDTLTKYEFLYKPDKKVSLSDVIRIFRDRMEGTEYEADIALGKTRVIATETASQVHVFKVHRDIPAKMAIEEWLCFSNSGYAPFVPISNAITSAVDEYTYVMPNYGLNEKSAFCTYKKLNALAAQNREYYGVGIERMWTEYESIWQTQFSEVLAQAVEYELSGKKRKAGQILTAYSTEVQNRALTQAKRTFDDLMWFIMEDTDTLRYSFSYSTLEYSETPYERTGFMPMLDAQKYAAAYGWKASDSGKELKLTQNGKVISIIPSDGKRTSLGTLRTAAKEVKIRAVRDDSVYIPLDIALQYIKK